MNKNNNSFREFTGMSILFLILILHLSGNASANVVNGDFEFGNFNNWSYGSVTPTLINIGGIYGDYTAKILRPASTVGYITKVEYLNGYTTLEYDIRAAYGADAWVRIYFDGNSTPYSTTKYRFGSASVYWVHDTKDISGANEYITVTIQSYAAGEDELHMVYFDNLELSYYYPSPTSINFNPDVDITEIKPVLCDYTIHPDDLNYYYDGDTKRVGNTVEIMNGWTSYSFPELPTLWISEGFTESNESGSHALEHCDSYNATYDIELRASWYELEGDTWLWHHGRDGLLLANDSILWTFNYTYPDPDPEPDPDPYDPPDPYVPPEIPTIPDDWNMTVPDKYQNVSWLTNYTSYFNEMGGTFNTTLYSVTGWVISPLMSLNNTVYSLRYYMAGTHNMVSSISHLHMMVNYGWAVIPVEIKTLFTGAAAIGVCIFLFKRRT